MHKFSKENLLKSLNYKIVIYFIAFAYFPLLIFSILGYYLNKDMLTRVNLDNLRTLNLGYANEIRIYLDYNRKILEHEPATWQNSDFIKVEKITGGEAVTIFQSNKANLKISSLPYLENSIKADTVVRGYFSVHKLQELLHSDISEINVHLYFIAEKLEITTTSVKKSEESAEYVDLIKLKTLASRESWHQYNTDLGIFSAYTYFPEHQIITISEIDANAFYAELTSFRNKILLANLLLALILLALALYYSRQITTPIYKLIEAVQHIGKGNLDHKINVASNDEIQILANEFELMRRKLQESYHSMEDKIKRRTEELQGAQAQIMHQEKMASLGLMAAGIAHEIGNPLTSISSMAQIIKRKNNDEKTIEYVNNILKNIERISRIVRELVDFSKPTTHKAAPSNINEIVNSAVGIIKYDRRSKNINYTLNLDNSLPSVNVVADHLMQVFLNILINAIDASEDYGDQINVATYFADEKIHIEIKDHGCGIPADKLNKIFEPFYTTKEVGKGTGLGLTVSYGLIKKLNGSVEVQSKINQGSTFTVVLPVQTGV